MEGLYLGYCEINMGMFLDTFTKAVKEDGYERVPYTIWNNLKKEDFLYLHAYRRESDASYDFVFANQRGNIQGVCVFNSKDKSLGAFCLERYLDFILQLNKGNTKEPTGIKGVISSVSVDSQGPYEAPNIGLTVNVSPDSYRIVESNLNTLDTYPEVEIQLSSNGTYHFPYADAIETMKKTATAAGTLKTSIVEMADEAYKYVSKSYNDKNEEGERKMNAFNFDFGPVKSTVHMSPFGLAIRNKDGNYVSYHDGGIVNVDPFNIEGLSKYIYKMPTATNAIKPGDLIVHSGNIVFVDSVAPGFTSLNVIDICDGTKKEIIPTKSMFGFDFVTKIVCLLGDFPTTANPDNPFGNILPFLLMGNSDVDIDPVVAMALCGGNFNEMNPMLMYAMIGKGNNDLLPMMFLSQQGVFNKK